MSNVLCTRCKACMCDDCRSMVDEYVKLFELWRQRAAGMEYQAKKAIEERDAAVRQVDSLKEVVVAGMGDILRAWLLSMDIERIDRLIKSQEKWENLAAEMDAALTAMDWKRAKQIRDKLEW